MNEFFDATPDPVPDPPPEATNPVVANQGQGQFTVTWQGGGSLLSCGDAGFAVNGETHQLTLPADLPYGIKHQCRIDQSGLSNQLGCLKLSQCTAW